MLQRNRFPIDVTIQSLNNQSLHELLQCLLTIFSRNALTVRVVTTALSLQLRGGCVFIIFVFCRARIYIKYAYSPLLNQRSCYGPAYN